MKEKLCSTCENLIKQNLSDVLPSERASSSLNLHRLIRLLSVHLFLLFRQRVKDPLFCVSLTDIRSRAIHIPSMSWFLSSSFSFLSCWLCVWVCVCVCCVDHNSPRTTRFKAGNLGKLAKQRRKRSLSVFLSEQWMHWIAELSRNVL